MGGERGGRRTVWWRATCWASLTTAPTTRESLLYIMTMMCVCLCVVVCVWGDGAGGRGGGVR